MFRGFPNGREPERSALKPPDSILRPNHIAGKNCLLQSQPYGTRTIEMGL